ncbi:MAG: FliI/YscN family ATPase [Sedimentisphaerales bacterium]|nr:FliI/YscN family ATPase [Sedimentisphaerales bacterium]
MKAALRDNWKIRIDSSERIMAMELTGTVIGMAGLTIDVCDFPAPVGAACLICTKTAGQIDAEVIGFRGEIAILMPLGEMAGIAGGDRVVCIAARRTFPLGENLLGRVIDASGRPLDGKGPLLCQVNANIEANPLRPLERTRIDTPISTGIRAVDAMLTCGGGQRMGIFAGPGVGKSVLMGMIAKFTSADVNVIALIGERGREVREFIERDLGPEGLARSVVVVSTSDEPAPVRVRSGFAACTVAEYFRDQGKNVLMLMDSATRVAMAQRQIGLAMGEPPATKGYTPSVFSILPRLLERCGRGPLGSITGFYTVLVEGDDLSDPVADAMRSILDGHLWLSRDLANRGHYPAIDILESISRVMSDIVDNNHKLAARLITRMVAVYRDIEDLVNIGAYAPGGNQEYDLAVAMRDEINAFLQQDVIEKVTFEQAQDGLMQLIAKMQVPSSKGRK